MTMVVTNGGDGGCRWGRGSREKGRGREGVRETLSLCSFLEHFEQLILPSVNFSCGGQMVFTTYGGMPITTR